MGKITALLLMTCLAGLMLMTLAKPLEQVKERSVEKRQLGLVTAAATVSALPLTIAASAAFPFVMLSLGATYLDAKLERKKKP
ncbi:hypothetical protein PoB_002398800 [Plakobranchus ocellatus]|uniref:Uncharacterized protein n=1 Tax=Plakobranchus ocellatus TaxID=259542 RepID=A0AAV3ZSJ3_9GAST|nr:hypothetical protein PoB_002398800 [Plakobranchus ocellatus]